MQICLQNRQEICGSRPAGDRGEQQQIKRQPGAHSTRLPLLFTGETSILNCYEIYFPQPFGEAETKENAL